MFEGGGEVCWQALLFRRGGGPAQQKGDRELGERSGKASESALKPLTFGGRGGFAVAFAFPLQELNILRVLIASNPQCSEVKVVEECQRP